MTKEFEYIKINERQKPILLEVINRGKVTLYVHSQTSYFPVTFNENNFMRGSTYNSKTIYVKRKNEKIAINLSGRFKKKSIEYFKDCPEILDIFSTKEYLRYRIEDIVNEYNIYCSDD